MWVADTLSADVVGFSARELVYWHVYIRAYTRRHPGAMPGSVQNNDMFVISIVLCCETVALAKQRGL